MQRLFIAIVFSALLLSVSCGGGSGPAETSIQPASDTTPPKITNIAGIENGAMVAGSAIITATATDDTGIASFRLAVDGETRVDAPLPVIQYSWDVRQVPDGPCTLEFRASDAAGNATSTTLQVTVANDPANADFGPEGAQQFSVAKLGTWDAAEFALPAMDPALFDPDDSENPTLLVSGLPANRSVYGSVVVNAVGLDDTGVNFIGFVVNGTMLEFAECSGLSLSWDTTQWPDSLVRTGFILRDNGGSLYQSYCDVTIDNTTEHDPPELTLTGFDQTTVTGLHHLEVHAEDASGVDHLTLILEQSAYGPSDADGGPDTIEVSARGNELIYDWDTAQHKNSWFRAYVDAVDVMGASRREYAADFWALNNAYFLGAVTDVFGWKFPGVAAYVVPRDYHGDPQTLPGTDCVARGYTNTDFFYFSDERENLELEVPFGEYKLLLVSNEYVLSTDLISSGIFDSMHPTFHLGEMQFATMYKQQAFYGLSPFRLAVAWGRDDRVDDLFAAMSPNETSAWQVQHRISYDGAEQLPAGFTDFCEVLAQEITGERLWSDARTLVIDSGIDSEEDILTDADLAAALRHWVMDGGHLLVIGRSYDFIEQLWPEKIDFAGDPQVNGLGAAPEAINAAQIGPAWLEEGGAGTTAAVTCRIQNPANIEYTMQGYFTSTTRQSFPFHVARRFAEYHCEYFEDVMDVPVRGFDAGWPVIERTADDVAVWMTVNDTCLEGVPAGTPVQCGFTSGLGMVLFTSHLMCDGDYSLTPQAYCVTAQLGLSD